MNYTFDFTKVRPKGQPLARSTVTRFIDAVNLFHDKLLQVTPRRSAILESNCMYLPPLPPLFGGNKMSYTDQIKNEPVIMVLEKLCDYPSLYVNNHFREENGEKIYVVTISNAEPIVSEERTAIWQKNDIAIDLFYDPSITRDNLNINTLNVIIHWIKIVCSILTFRGHEVFLDNKLFQPYE